MMEERLILKQARVEALKAIWPNLTDRQKECWLLDCLGLTQAEIGQVLGIEQQVVSTHLGKVWDNLKPRM